MTDFFADLEREIRAAHPRRARPAVPVKGLAVTAAVAAALFAVVIGLGALAPSAEREVATQPATPEGWTAYGPDCTGRVVDGRIPEELVDRFAILRGDAPAVDLPRERVPDIAVEVVRQSLREVEGPEGRRFMFAVVRMGDAGCRSGTFGVCLLSLSTDDGVCSVPGVDDFVEHFVQELPGGRKLFAMVAEDGIRETRIETLAERVRIDGNTGFALAGGDADQGVEPLAGDECVSDLDMLKRRLQAFSRPAAPDARSLGVVPGGGQELRFLHEARIFEAHGTRYVVFPGCGTTVCMWREGTENTVCGKLPSREDGRLVLTHHTERDEMQVETAGLVAGEARAVRYGKVEAPVHDGFFALAHAAHESVAVEVVPAS